MLTFFCFFDSDAPPMDVVVDPNEELHEAFREEWLDMEQEIEEFADEGEEEKHAVHEEGGRGGASTF